MELDAQKRRWLITAASAFFGSMLAMLITGVLVWGLFAIPAGLAGYFVPDMLKARSARQDSFS